MRSAKASGKVHCEGSTVEKDRQYACSARACVRKAPGTAQNEVLKDTNHGTISFKMRSESEELANGCLIG